MGRANTTSRVGMGLSQRDNPRDLYLLGMCPFTGDWPTGPAVLLGCQLALDHVNERQDVLPGYTLHAVWEDTKVGLYCGDTIVLICSRPNSQTNSSQF